MRYAIACIGALAIGSGAAYAQQHDRAALSVKQSKEYGAYLADADGRALYLLEADEKGRSTCYEKCAQVWPPLRTAQGKPVPAETSVRSGLIGTLKRQDGSMQVTYNGHPLYYYVKDEGREATGQDVHDRWGEWYLVTPRGEKLGEE